MGQLMLFRICTAVLATLTLAGCASTGAVPAPFPTPRARTPAPGTPDPTSPLPSSVVSALVGTALGLRGVPYRNGGSDPSGFDCSGFVQFVFAQHGLKVPRGVKEQYSKGHSIPSDALEPGDLLFFTTTAPGASHVAIARWGHPGSLPIALPEDQAGMAARPRHPRRKNRRR